ncbi:carboxyl transferase domain-containing protein [Streptomyces sp. NPDC006654]|uniref:carboxyl transferase domain-containing protein n=1 Tax=Streptomyces sp. NPDC006654 TaxID=3156897 RepID=UPI0033FC2E61
MKFLVLGVPGVERSDGSVTHLRRHQATLLVELLAAESEIVSADRLSDALYRENTPLAPLRALHAHMVRIRRALREWEPEGPGAQRLVTSPSGYALKVSPSESDAGRFRALLTQARALLPENPDAAAHVLQSALALWRGLPLEGVEAGAGGDQMTVRLEAGRREAVELLATARLAAGENAQAVADLQSLLLRDPYDESLARLLATALSQSGRPLEAQRVEEHVRTKILDGTAVSSSAGQPSPGLAPARAHGGLVPRPRDHRQIPRVVPADFSLLASVIDPRSLVSLGGSARPGVPDVSVTTRHLAGAVAGVARIGGRAVAVIRDGAAASLDVPGASRTLEYARKTGIPVVVLLEETDLQRRGADGPACGVTVVRSLLRLRGVVPRIVVSRRRTPLQPSVAEVLGDVHLVVGPVSAEGACGSSPVAEITVRTPEEAASHARRLLDCVSRRLAPTRPPYAGGDPVGHHTRVNMSRVIAGLVDEGCWAELMAGTAGGLITGIGRVEGVSVGVVANNRQVEDGRLTEEAARKGARMVDLCALWNLPLAVLVDVPEMPGSGSPGTAAWLGAEGGELLRAFLRARVLRVTVIVGRAKGWSRVVMGASESGSDAVYAWSTALTDRHEDVLDGVIAPEHTRTVVGALLSGADPLDG